jgi:hypothetical protein
MSAPANPVLPARPVSAAAAPVDPNAAAAAAAAPAVARVPNFGPSMDLALYRNLKSDISAGNFVAPVGFQNQVNGLDAGRVQEWFDVNIPEATRNMASGNTRLLLGTTPTDVITEMLIALTAARISKNPSTLIQSMVLSVYVAYTVSRDWVLEYAQLPPPHMFTGFEITGRQAGAPVNGLVKDGWVQNSTMNATALHLAGHVIVEIAEANSVLGKLKSTKGTVFNPPSDAVKTEQADIMREFTRSLTQADSQALMNARTELTRLVAVVNGLFGGAGANVQAALAAALAVRIREF